MLYTYMQRWYIGLLLSYCPQPASVSHYYTSNYVRPSVRILYMTVIGSELHLVPWACSGNPDHPVVAERSPEPSFGA